MSQLSAPLTCLTVGSLGAVYAVLQLRVGLHRKNTGILFGTAPAGSKLEDEALITKMRAGGNMQDYLPLGVIMMLLLETSTPLPKNAVAAFGATLAVSRLAHAYGISNTYNPKAKAASPARIYGFLTTVGALVSAGVYLTFHAVKAVSN